MNEENIKLAQQIALTAVHIELIGKLPEEEIKEVLKRTKLSLEKPTVKDGYKQVDEHTWIK